jgi:hypothetical protein
MIGKGKSISHTKASLAYGWNQEKEAEIVYIEYLIGETPNEITKEFELIQQQNCRCTNNTLSFVLSPTIEDGKNLSKEDLGEIVKCFLKEMELDKRQAVAFVHRDKAHVHIHAYVNRIDFNGKAYPDNFIGKRSQYVAEEVAKQMELTTARSVQQEQQGVYQSIRKEMHKIHKDVLQEHRPKSIDTYIKHMKAKDIEVIPSINRSNKLQGFRFEYKGHNLKGSEVHRSMSESKILQDLSKNKGKSILHKSTNTVAILSQSVEPSTRIATKLAKQIIKRAIDTGIGIDIGY